MFATIYIYVLLFEFQNMFATMYGCSSFDELLRSKVKNGKKGEEALRSYPYSVDKKTFLWRFLWERRCRNEIRNMTSFIPFFSLYVRIPPMVVTIRTPRVHSKALRRSPADSHVINEPHQLRRGALELGNSLKDVRTRVASSTLHISLQDCG